MSNLLIVNNASGLLAQPVAPADTQIFVSQELYDVLPDPGVNEAFVVTLSNPNNVTFKHETVLVESKQNVGPDYILDIATRDYDGAQGNGGTFTVLNTTVSLRLTARQLNEIYIHKRDNTVLAPSGRLRVDTDLTVFTDPIDMVVAYQTRYTAGGTQLTVFPAADITSDPRYQVFIYINGIRQKPGASNDYQLVFQSPNTVCLWTGGVSLLAGTVVDVEVYRAD